MKYLQHDLLNDGHIATKHLCFGLYYILAHILDFI